jgi:DNA-binding NarL/FixJ family response regulator
VLSPDHLDVEPTELGVLIVDNVRIYREGLASILARQSGIGRVQTACDAEAAGALLAIEPADVALLNVADGNHDLVHAVRAADPSISIIVIGVSDREDDVMACAEAGVAGYLLRTEPLDHLLRVMRSVATGESLCSPRIAALLLRRVQSLSAQRRSATTPALTDREDDVLALLELGLSNQEISDRLGITVRTVKNHVHNILEKVGARRRGEAVAAVRRRRQGGDGPDPRGRYQHNAPGYQSRGPGSGSAGTGS